MISVTSSHPTAARPRHPPPGWLLRLLLRMNPWWRRQCNVWCVLKFHMTGWCTSAVRDTSCAKYARRGYRIVQVSPIVFSNITFIAHLNELFSLPQAFGKWRQQDQSEGDRRNYWKVPNRHWDHMLSRLWHHLGWRSKWQVESWGKRMMIKHFNWVNKLVFLFRPTVAQD